jgi:hypothetical protein
LIFLFIISFSSLCIETKKNLTVLNLSGELFVFSTNLYDAIKFNSTNETEIKKIFDESPRICFTFNNQSTRDNSYFAVISFNTVYKITRYYSLHGMKKEIRACNNEPKVIMLGPHSGAKTNSISLINRTIILQATSYQKLKEGGDKLVLIVFGIESLENEK